MSRPELIAADLIRAEIGRTGPIGFERFMELALYASGSGYYASARDPFGAHGDFYTAAQLQPTFGILIRRIAGQHLLQTGARAVIDLGAGRGEMAEAFAGFDYNAVDRGRDLPHAFTGVIFANEFFDALPVQLYERAEDGFVEMLVATDQEQFKFCAGGPATAPLVTSYLERYHRQAPIGTFVEVNARAIEWVHTLSRAVVSGTLLICDYGYTAQESIRFPRGTLMSYHRHAAREDVLQSPGERDITAHVAWTPLIDAFAQHGWTAQPLTSLARALLDAGEADQFAELFSGCNAQEELRRRMQLKTLLFGMGETFQMLTLHK